MNFNSTRKFGVTSQMRNGCLPFCWKKNGGRFGQENRHELIVRLQFLQQNYLYENDVLEKQMILMKKSDPLQQILQSERNHFMMCELMNFMATMAGAN